MLGAQWCQVMGGKLLTFSPLPPKMLYPSDCVDQLWNIPDYPNDLDAIAQAEDAIFPQRKGCGDYYEMLQEVTKDEMPYRAKAGQRLEALLRCGGSWGTC